MMARSPGPPFLSNLLLAYAAINQQLSRLTHRHFEHSWAAQLADVPSTHACLDRSLRREHEYSLFTDTLDLAKAIQKKMAVKHSDLAMKYGIVCQVLTTRVQELLDAPPAVKEGITRKITSSRQGLMSWIQDKQKKKVSASSQQTKQTDRYLLKYAFTDVSNTNTTDTLQNSVLHSSFSRTLQNWQSVPDKTLTNTSPVPEPASDLPRNSVMQRRATQAPGVKDKIRRVTKFSKTSPLDKTRNQNKTVTAFSPLQQKSDRDSSSQLSQDIKNSLKSSASPKIQGLIEQKLKQLTNKDHNNCHITFDVQNQKQEDQRQDEEFMESKKSDYYISQNYIRSRKTIQSVSLVTNKRRKNKRSGGCPDALHDLATEVNDCEQIIKEDTFRQGATEHSIRKPKYFTKKDIIDDEDEDNRRKDPFLFVSQKSMTKHSKFNINQLITTNMVTVSKHPKPMNRVPRKATRESARTFNRGSLKRTNGERYISHQAYKMSQFHDLKGAEVSLENENQEKTNETTKTIGSKFSNIYGELVDFRNQIHYNSESYLKDYTVFFRQQKKISDEKSKQYQKILSERRSQGLLNTMTQQFQLKVEIEHRSPPSPQIQFQSAYVSAMRSLMTECVPLGQSGSYAD